ncbi:peptidase M14, partial [Pseudomonas sp. HMWF031]
MERIDHSLPWSHLGSERQISVFRFGTGERKAYIQASLHADELPGMRTAWALKKRLAELEAQGLLNGVIELVPVANPLGLGQLLQGNHQGRFEAGSGKNFNRDFVELSAPVAAEVAGHLGDDPHANIRLIRQAMSDALAALPPASSQLQGMQ